MDFTHDFTKAQQNISAALVSTIRVATRVSVEDVAFHRASSVATGRSIDRQNARLLSLTERLLRRAVTDFNTSLTGLDSLDHSWNTIVDTLDNLLERSDTCLDEFSGRFKQQIAVVQPDLSGQYARPPKKTLPVRAPDLPKPQLSFNNPPSNYAHPPFRPLLDSKPHAIVPLDQSLGWREGDDQAQHTQHPYEFEIDTYRYPCSVYTSTEPTPSRPFVGSGAIFVEDFDAVLAMLEELKTAKEIAIDLEHHDIHSYIGMVSLMQISSRDRNWIVDTLKPWRRKLSVLNEVFADPNILKILHGAQMDIVWLQRDLGLYIVGLFDTHHASRVLGYAGGSLAFLLKKFVDFDAQKQYQTADWRLRPLPQEMLEYARSDTHFLLYIYDCMRNDLIQRSKNESQNGDLVQLVLNKSKETALQTYEYASYDFDQGLGRAGWFTLIQKNMSPMSKEQFAVFRRLHQWRDNLARQEDEGIPTIMANHVLLNIARALPRDMAGLFTVSHPISQAVRLRASEVLELIRSTTSTSLTEPTLADKITEIMQVRPGLVRRAGVVLPTVVAATSSESQDLPSNTIEDFRGNMRSSSSLFWGDTVGDTSLPANPSSLPTDSSNRMTLPVPPYPSDTFPNIVGGVSSTTGTSKAPASTPDSLPPEQRFQSEDYYGKRKLDSLVDGEDGDDPAAANAIDMIDGTAYEKPIDEGTAAAGLAAKRARKELKKQARAAQSTVGSQLANGGSSKPFDYGATASVLHAAQSGHLPKAAARPFNPYAKAADAPQGLRKKPDIQGSRSATFKH